MARNVLSSTTSTLVCVAGLCLYGLWFNGFTLEPFLPVDDGSDAFFLGLPYTQGLAFTPAQWQRLDAAFAGEEAAPHPDLHPCFQRFRADEWWRWTGST